MRLSLAVIYSLLYVMFLSAQTTSDSSINVGHDQNSISVSGEIGAYGELYSMEGQPGRRPKSSGRLFFRPTVSIFGLFQVPFEFLLSTEGSSARQNINQFGINPSWDWGTLHLGDFSDDYSQLILSGINIRGGGIDLYPGILRFATAAGFTQRSVPGGAQDGSYKRFLFAAKLGIGRETSSFIDLIILKAKDEIGSLDHSGQSLTVISPNGNDILEIGSIQTIRWNSYGIAGGIRVELSRDGGNTFEIIGDNQPNVGYYNWTVTGPATFQAIIKITAIENIHVFDLSDQLFTIGTGVQSNIVSNTGEIVNPNAVTPQENLVVGTKGRINFLSNKLSFEFDAAGSIYSRDLRSPPLNLDSADVPSFISGIYKVRPGSDYDYALNTYLNLHLSDFNSRIGYKRIGPGYTSLGTAYLVNDIGEYSIMNSLRISNVVVSFGYIYQKDNLINQKQFTTSRNLFNVGFTSMITDRWNASISANIMNMGNDAADSVKTDFSSLVIGTNQSILIDPRGTFRNITVNYSYQTTDNQSFNLKNNKTSVHTINLGASFSIMPELVSTLNGGLIKSSIYDTISTTTQNYGLLLQHNAFNNKLISNGSINYAKSESNISIRYTIGAGYQFAASDIISVSLSYMKFDGSTFRGGNFTEMLSSLNYSHRF